MTKKLNDEQKQELLVNEESILQGVLAAAEDLEDTTKTIEVARPGANGESKALFSFEIKPLTQKDYEKAGELATKFKRLKGRKMVDSYSQHDANLNLISMATVKEDYEKIWNNKDIRESLNAFHATEVIEKVLLAGEIQAVVEVIDEISGFSLDKDDMIAKEAERVEELKN